mgnify:CR=1 FL=1
MKRLILILGVVFFAITTNAQQESMFTHYSFNTMAINPGYAGSRDALTLTGLHRSQWVSFPGAPTTQTVTVHAPLANNKMGLGLSLLHDQIGPTSNSSVNVDLAYRVQVGTEGHLSFGLKGGLNFMSSNLQSEVTTLEEGDAAFQNNIQSELLPNFGFGIYYANPKLFVGLSSPRLLNSDILSGEVSNFSNNLQRHYYLITGAMLSLNKKETVKFKPTAFFRLTDGAPLQMDFTALFYFKDKYWIGPMFRVTDQVGVLSGLNIIDQFSLAYSFDWSFNSRSIGNNYGSHELMLRYDFMYKTKGGIVSPRYF